MSAYRDFVVLVCGGRDFNDWAMFNQAMSSLPKKPSLIVHGDAPGADTMAKLWAKSNGIYPVAIPELWNTYGKPAGNKRNMAMALIMNPDYVVAFPGGTGTDDMVSVAEEMAITVWRPYL